MPNWSSTRFLLRVLRSDTYYTEREVAGFTISARFSTAPIYRQSEQSQCAWIDYLTVREKVSLHCLNELRV